MKKPLVSMIMVTGKDPSRRRLALAAAKSCLAQKYPRIELVVVNTGERLGLPDDRVVELCVPQGEMTLGDLRNLGLDTASGDFIAQTDDDDWHHPERIGLQVKACQPGGATVLYAQVRYSFPHNAAYMYWTPGIAGTVLHARTPARYPSLGKNEDSQFLNAFAGNLRLVENQRAAHLYLRFYHGDNTWDEEHIMRGMRGDQWKHCWLADPQDVYRLDRRAAGYLYHTLRDEYGVSPERLNMAWEKFTNTR